MVMARRHPLPLLVRVRGWIWPHIGWRRAGRYVMRRLHRLPGTPHSIAAGAASGIAISFIPLIGFHLLGAFALCWLFRGNYLAGVIGSLVGNPWTLPFLFASDYRLGSYLLGRPSFGLHLLAELSWSRLVDELWLIFWPMLIGAFPLAIVSGLASYFVLVPLVARVQERRRQRIARGVEAALAAKARNRMAAPFTRDI
jgi:hypothetical protein